MTHDTAEVNDLSALEHTHNSVLYVVGLGTEAYEALLAAFASYEEVGILQGDILNVASNCVVSPANSSGMMDGGIDLDYLGYFGSHIEKELQELISKLPAPGLKIGTCVHLETGDSDITWMIAAPTVVEPGFTEKVNIGRALYALLKHLKNYPHLQPCYSPLLGSGVGGVLPEVAAKEMASAYRDWILKNTL